MRRQSLTAKSGISNHAAAGICDDPCLSKFGALPECVRKPADNFRTFVCVPLWHLWTKHNRAKPMSELPSAIFLIADGNEFRFARFYIVCEEVPLGTPESPLIVCSLSDTLRECPNVAKTRNGMPATAWKKYVNFASKNLPPSVYSGTFLFSGLLIILLINPKHNMLIATILSYICLVLKRDNGSVIGVVDVLLDLIRL